MVVNKSDCIAGLREAASILGKSPTAKEYSSLDVSPSMKTITTKFGSWNEAKDTAELERRESTYNRKRVNLNYFAEIDLSTQAYWLGFLYGDGCIRKGKGDVFRLQLALAEEDRKHVKKFKEAVNSDHKLNEIKREGNTQDQVSIVISRREFVENLRNHELDENKTKSASLPDISTERLQASFIRGLYDADGHQMNYGWKVTGSSKERFIKLQDWLPVESQIYTQGKYYDLIVQGENKLTKLANWLYPNGKDTEPMLERKFLKWWNSQ